MSHSHVEDGLLVSHYLAVSNRQRVVASLQVKIFKCQLDHLDNGGDINETNEGSRCLNTPWTKCRGEISSHLWLPFPLFINPSYISFFFFISVHQTSSCIHCSSFFILFFLLLELFSPLNLILCDLTARYWYFASVSVYCVCWLWTVSH